MTHGDKAKAKSAKAETKASGKKASSQKAGAKESSRRKEAPAKGAEAKKDVKQTPGSRPGLQASTKAETSIKGKASAKAGAAKAGAAKTRAGAEAEDGTGFTNPAVANAFKRAVKKYPNAFRRLTD